MKEESVERLKQAMIETYRKFGDDRAIRTRGGKSYTGNEVANEIENETKFGLDLIEMMLNIKKDKIN
jgi:hypothetical protein